MKRAFRTVAYVTIFAVLSSLLVGWMSRDAAPRPLFNRFSPSAWRPIVRGAPAAFAWTIGVRPPDAIRLVVRDCDDDNPLVVLLTDADRDRELIRQSVFRPGTTRIVLLHLPDDVERLQITLSSETDDEDRAPEVLWTDREAEYSGSAMVGGTPEESGGPLLKLDYERDTRMTLLGWSVVLILLPATWSRERLFPWFLVVLTLCCASTSILLWQTHYGWHYDHWDADHYGEYAERLAHYVTQPETRGEFTAWARGSPITHTPLAPAVMAIPIAFGVPRDTSYLEFSTLCGFGSLWLVVRILRRRLGVSYELTLVGATAFACHLLMLRSMSRPVTDVFGLLLVLLTLDLLLSRFERGGDGNILALGLLLLGHVLARPQGPALAAYIVVAAVLCDVLRPDGHRARLLRVAAWILAPPALVLLAAYAAFGWPHNFRIMLESAKGFRTASTWNLFYPAVIGVCQLMPLLWLPLIGRIRNKRLWLLAGSVAAYVAMLVAVRAPFWMRHFLPILPVVVTMAAWGADQLGRRLRGAAAAVLLAGCAANVAIIIYQIDLDTGVPRWILYYISSS